MHILLASKSPYRKRNLETLGVKFDVEASHIDENLLKQQFSNDLKLCSLELAKAKTKKLRQSYPSSLVIGGDQLAECQGQILGKPKSHAKAVSSLMGARGEWVNLHTALYLESAEFQKEIYEKVSLKLRSDLTEEEISRYVNFAEPLDCAASFKIELGGFGLFDEIQAEDFSSIEGLPLMKLAKALREAGLSLWADY